MYISCTGIASAEAFGAADVQYNINPAGITSSETFGSTLFVIYVIATAIGSQEAFGIPFVGPDVQNIDCVAIASSEIFGNAQLQKGTGIKVADSDSLRLPDRAESLLVTQHSASIRVAGHGSLVKVER